jgi:hypothetical protein
MPYCPQCRIEYVDGITHCDDCGTTLLPGSPPEPPQHLDLREEKDTKLVPVRVFAGGTAQMEAELARNILQSQGISSLVQGESAAEMLPVLDIPLLVREQDLPNAERILKDYFDTPAAIIPDDAPPSDGN